MVIAKELEALLGPRGVELRDVRGRRPRRRLVARRRGHVERVSTTTTSAGGHFPATQSGLRSRYGLVAGGAGLGRRDLVWRRAVTGTGTGTGTGPANAAGVNPGYAAIGSGRSSGSNGGGMLRPQEGDEIVELLLELGRPRRGGIPAAARAATIGTGTATASSSDTDTEPA